MTRDRHAAELGRYIRDKVDQLFVMMGSKPLRADELDDRTLIALDPIGTVSDAFGQILAHLREINARLQSEIEERHRAELALRDSEERFRTLAEFASSWVFWRGPDGRFVYVSPATEKITGYAPGEFYEDPELNVRIIAPRDRDRWVSHCHVADAQGLPDSMEFEIVARNGEPRWIMHQCRPVYGEDGEFLGVRGSNTDITDRKLTEQVLRESEEYLRDFIDNALDLIQIVGADGRFLRVNRTWRETLGYTGEEAAAMTIFDIIPQELRQHCIEVFRRVLAGENVGTIDAEFVAKDGRRVVVEGHANCRFVDGRPVATRSIFRDVTEKKKLEEELLKARKLESLGVLAGGIAHDFNNLLTAIVGNISLARLHAALDGEIAIRLADAEAASLRAKVLTRQLLTFSQGGAPVRKAAAIGSLIRDTVEFVLLGSNVRCDYSIPAELPPVEIDESQIGEVVRNLVANAVEAMPAGGVIAVRAGVSDGSGRENGCPNRPHVWIAIEDRGRGIPAADLPRIFDPFFTTKTKRSGLGLSAAYSIVRSHHGLITVRSEPGAGSTFTIHLPASAAPDGESKREGIARPAIGRVLVMDDEAAIRDVALHMLSYLGYAGESASEGSEAISMYREARESGAPFDVVIMDLTIPGGMGGKEAIERLRGLYPDVKAIVSSGYSNDPVLSDYAAYGFQGVIPKPYRVKDMVESLRRVLESPTP